MSAYAHSHLSRCRAEWFSRLSAGVLSDFADHGALSPDRFRIDLGDVEFVRGVLVARIARHFVTGTSPSAVVEWIRDREIFLAPVPDQEALKALVRQIQERMADQGLWDGPTPWSAGVRVWDPEGISDVLLRYWACQRGMHVSPQRLRRELTGCWGVEEPHLLDEWSHISTNNIPYLAGLTGLRSNNPAVIDLARQCLEHPAMETLVEQWESGFFWHGTELGHLFRIGSAIQKSWPARELFNQPEEVTGVPSGTTEKTHWATVDALLAHGNDHHEILQSLTPYEISLLDVLDQEQLFIDGCINMFVTNPGWNIRSDPFDTWETSPGSWGPIPWWIIALDNDRQVDAAKKVLEWRTHTLVHRLPTTDVEPLVLALDAPVLASVKVETEFWFYPNHARALCELLVIARRGTIAIEFWLIDQWDDTHPASKGTYLVPLPEELSEITRTWALERLRSLLPTLNRPLTPADFSPDGVIGSHLTDLLTRSSRQNPWPSL